MNKKTTRIKILLILLGTLIQAFAVYNVHSVSGVTEGGIIGLELLLKHWFGLSPAVGSLLINLMCYALAFKTFGKSFLCYSTISVASYSLFYAVLEQFPRVWPEIASYPLAAALVGGVLIGVGAGLSVKAGGATAGDDALAMALRKLWHVPIQRVYLISDLAVLALSLTYIPLQRILYSVLTVILSGQVLGFVAKKPIGESSENDL